MKYFSEDSDKDIRYDGPADLKDDWLFEKSPYHLILTFDVFTIPLLDHLSNKYTNNSQRRISGLFHACTLSLEYLQIVL